VLRGTDLGAERKVGIAYQGISKHKEPWQRGRRGSQCPRDVDASALLTASIVHPRNTRRRYATDGARFFEARPSGVQNAAGDDLWHGHPCDIATVPSAIQKRWAAQGLIHRMRLR
jgi:hypothetical protein